MRRKVLIFIHKSLGELDWIAPFLKSREAECFDIVIYLNKIGKNSKEKQALLRDYGLDNINVTMLEPGSTKRLLYKFIDRRLSKIKCLNSWGRSLHRFFGDKLGFDQNFDFIFRDYQLIDSFELKSAFAVNKESKVIIFPHAVGIQVAAIGFPDIKPIVKADLWLENSILSTKQIVKYKDVFFVSGAPGLSSSYERPSLFGSSVRNILINTRNNYTPYGSTRKHALAVFSDVLDFCNKQNFNVYVKHHPRENDIHEYREIQKNYNNVNELASSLTMVDIKFRACLSMYSTSGLFMTARQIPVFDITPYLDVKREKPLACHYKNEKGELTHDLIEIDVQEKLKSLDVLLDEKKLSLLAATQFTAIKKHFPSNSNSKISHKMKELLQ